eukprot:12420045-Karenia_brevis.AAC.1
MVIVMMMMVTMMMMMMMMLDDDGGDDDNVGDDDGDDDDGENSDNNSGKHLPYHHPRLASIRDFVRGELDGNDEFHPELLANFDQTWCRKFTPRSKILKITEGFSQLDKFGMRKMITSSIQDT